MLWTFQLFTVPCQWRDWGCTRRWERTDPGELTQAGWRDFPYYVASYEVIKPGELAGQGGSHGSGTGWASVSGWWAIALCITDFVNVYIDICTVIITFAGFFVVVVLSFSISVDSFYLNPWVLCFFPILSPISLVWESDQMAVVLSCCWVKLQHCEQLLFTSPSTVVIPLVPGTTESHTVSPFSWTSFLVENWESSETVSLILSSRDLEEKCI